MSPPDNAEVIQGRLGWEPGDVSEANPENLSPHPKQKEIYGDTETASDLDETFKESVAEKGVLEPLVITRGKQIVSGHRRWLAATDAGLDSVPVRYTEFDSDLAEREALVEFNRQREKTPGQIVNEFEEMLAIEQEKAEQQRKEKISESLSKESETKENLPSSQKSDKQAREKAAEKVNADVSGRTLEKGKKVKDKAQSDDEPEDVREAAKEAWENLQSGDESFNSAYKEVKQAEREHEEQQERQQNERQWKEKYENSDDRIAVKHGDFTDVAEDIERESVDAIITDPPYDADSLEVWQQLSEIGQRVLKPGGMVITYSGKAHLPKVINGLGKHLEYHWQGVVVHNGPGAKIFSRKLRTGYKPILIFGKEPIEPQSDFVQDVVNGHGREKDDHEWQQAEGEAAELIDRFTNTNDRILDPMCGSGTVGVAAVRLNRQCVLIDRDKSAVNTARGRVMDES